VVVIFVILQIIENTEVLKMNETNWNAKKQIEKQGFKTEQNFAKHIGLSRTVLSQILKGRLNPTAEEKEKINKGLGANVV
jgi:transcriptional regulator with XRE-family HTH domain